MKLDRISIEGIVADMAKKLVGVLESLPERTIFGEDYLTVSVNPASKTIVMNATYPDVSLSIPIRDQKGLKFNFPKGSRNRKDNGDQMFFSYKGFKFELYAVP